MAETKARQMKLTDLSVRALKPPEKGAVTYHDDILRGFGVRVSQAGTKCYVLTHGARRRRQTIGRVIKLAEAREAAKFILAAYTVGKSRPRTVQRLTAVSEFAEAKAQRRKQTLEAYKRHLNYFPFGQTRLHDIAADDLHGNDTWIKTRSGILKRPRLQNPVPESSPTKS